MEHYTTATTPATQHTTGLKLIGAGFGRTGTYSLKAALEDLGVGPCYHMTEVFQHPEHALQWIAASEGQPVDWDQIFDGFQATVDWPGCTFYRQLMEHYPDAKVLLSVREPEKWYHSAQNTIYQVHLLSAEPSLVGRFRRALLRVMRPEIYHVIRMINIIVWNKTFHDQFADKASSLAIYQRHIDEVKSQVPPERLLVYSVKEGWEPLCAFLGVPVPDKPFPHLNDQASFNQRSRGRFIPGRALLAGTALFVLITTWLIRRSRKK